jgi:hypothetical protein
MEYRFDFSNRVAPVPSGTLLGFYCGTPGGVAINLELASILLDKGRIETRQFGTIRTDGSGLTAQDVQFYMTEDQIVRLKKFLMKR